MFYIKVKDLEERTTLLEYLKENAICAVFHYVPLHTSEAGLRFSTFYGKDIYTTIESERLIRLPMYYGLNESDIYIVIKAVKDFFEKYNWRNNKIEDINPKLYRNTLTEFKCILN